MPHAVVTWVLVAAFVGAGVVNAIGSAATRRSFVRWGYPAWWCRVTGGTEILLAILVAWPPTRPAGLVLSALVIAAAVATVIRHRDFSHLAPLTLFGLLIAGVVLTR